MEGPSVSKSFMKDLRLMDKRLGITWNGRNHIITYQRPQGDAVSVYRIKNEDGSYKPPDARDLIVLRGGDLCGEDMKTRLQHAAAYSESIREKANRDAHDNIRAMTLDNRRQLANTVARIGNYSKGNSTFRRIEPPKTGKTWDEIKAGA